MAARCETVGRFVLPVFRALVAKELVNVHHMTQADTAKRLGTTQAAISYYLTSKRAIKGREQFADMMPKIESMAAETAKRMAKNEATWAEVTSDFCSLCAALYAEEDDYMI